MRKNDTRYEMVDRSDHSSNTFNINLEDEHQQPQPVFQDYTIVIHKLSSQMYYLRITLFTLMILTIMSLAVVILVKQQSPRYDDDTQLRPITPLYGAIKRIAFGSCTAYDLRNWDIFTTAIIPAQPDAWIWLGDMVYLDDPEIDCSAPNPTSQLWQESCNCTATWLHTPPFSCHAGDITYATERYLKALSNAPYISFLKYMCPESFSQQYDSNNNYINSPFPPIGTDPMQCDHGPILGIYDDHDFGWNNGNSREPFKYLFKQLYLDMVGEPTNSYRRGAGRGLYGQGMTFNSHLPGREVAVFMLDERYERVPLPCGTRKVECLQGKDLNSAWCRDFLETCCTKDDDIYFGWCVRHPIPPALSAENAYELWQVGCNTSSPSFGMLSLAVDTTDDSLYQITPDKFPQDGKDHFQDGSFCEVLGINQRKWLRQALTTSTAPVKLILSGSVLLHNPQPYACSSDGNGQCYCGGDDWDCYRAAQTNLLHLLGGEEVSGCVIVLTGDYHFSDLKKLEPGSGHIYSNYSVYGSDTNVRPVWQVMASGLTSSTAHEPQPCVGYRRDPLHLRTHEECSFVTGANYGRMLLEYDETAADAEITLIRLQILGGRHGKDIRLESVIDPRKDCLRLNRLL